MAPMAPLRSPPNFASGKRRSSLSLLSTRRRSFAPKNYTFAPNVTPITYPSDPASPSSNARSSQSPNPDGSDIDVKESDENALLSAETTAALDSNPSRPRRRGGRKGSIDHIPRPPNAFMLFRQNFVHQRHVPGSIETSHNSLSKIVGNCWKALPAKEKKVWEALAEKKKQEHKVQYPHYRFQPKHDPEKKRKRQAARAAAERTERERLMREQGLSADVTQSILEGTTGDKLQLQQPSREQEKDHAMASRREQVRAIHNHLGHRRSSSVPLPSETYPGYPYGGSYGQSGSNADPFNFANPAVAQAPLPPDTLSSNRIAIPSLPSSMGGMVNPWFAPNNAASLEQAGNSEQTNGHVSVPTQLHIPQPRTAAPSRSASPRIPMNATGFGFGEFSGMSSMGMSLMGMGPRASRQWALGQLGRRASSTQPILQHQLASGVFGNYHLGPQSNFPHPAVPFGQHSAQSFVQGNTSFGFGADQNQQQGGFDGFVGAVAEGFTNPFASTVSSANAVDGSATSADHNLAPTTSTNSFSAPLAPNAVWYEDSVDPMTPVGAQSSQYAQVPTDSSGLPPVDTTVMDPAFNFGDNNVGNATGRAGALTTPKSASTSAPHTAMRSRFGSISGSVQNSNSEPGTGMRDSFDFGAFNAFLQQMPAQNQAQVRVQQQELQSYEHVTPTSVSPNETQYPLVQPIPVRKVDLPYVTETQSAPAMYHGQTYPEHMSYQEQYTSEQVPVYSQEQNTGSLEQPQYPANQPNSSASSGSSSTDASPAGGFVPTNSHQHQHSQQHDDEIISGHELLDGAVDVNSISTAHAAGMQQAPTDSMNGLDFGYNYDTVGAVDSRAMYQMHMGLGGNIGSGYAAYSHDAHQAQDVGSNITSNDQNSGPRFSLSDFVLGSPFIASASTVTN